MSETTEPPPISDAMRDMVTYYSRGRTLATELHIALDSLAPLISAVMREDAELRSRLESAERERDFAEEHIGKEKFAGKPDDIVRLHADSTVTSDFWRRVGCAELRRRENLKR